MCNDNWGLLRELRPSSCKRRLNYASSRMLLLNDVLGTNPTGHGIGASIWLMSCNYYYDGSFQERNNVSLN